MSISNYSDDVRTNIASIKRQHNHHHLGKFKEAKKEISVIYNDILTYVSDCIKFANEYDEEKFEKMITVENRSDMNRNFIKLQSIQDIIARNQMKCAFFGRTSNGKSTVINAMLGSRLLPSCVGHTTSCFLEVQGTNKDSGYLLTGAKSTDENNNAVSDQPHSIESVSQLAHALSGFKLSTETLLKIYWPSSSCSLLREDVVLLDSPGINVDPDIDRWIDLHCLDADVFILVANAESTLMQAEKEFFHKVSQKLSKPNIFILNNRWDASANEMEFAKEVRDQHMQRCVEFLVDELKVASHSDAEEHVFFISAREALVLRSKLNLDASNSLPPGAASMSSMAEGWQDRMNEFLRFESIFEKILSESATRTKFAAHSEQGKEIISRIRCMMETIYETTVEEKDSAIRLHHLSQAHVDEVRGRLMKTTQSIDEMFHASLARVEAQVASALNSEIRRINELVDSYSRPFHPDAALLHVYKNELNTHIERELGRKLTEACSNDILNEVARSEQVMIAKHASLVPDETWKSRILQVVDPSNFSPEFHVDCRNLCADFREDIEFRFSLSIGVLLQKLSTGRKLYPWSLQSSISEDRSRMSSYTSNTPWTIDLFPASLSRGTVGAVFLFFFVTKAIGWRSLGVGASIYGLIYLYERMSWTNKAKEAAFKRQYVDFASHKLRLIVDLTSNNARHQAKRELHISHKKVSDEVKLYCEQLVQDVKQLDEDIGRLDSIIYFSKQLKNRANSLLNVLVRFHEQFITNPWNEATGSMQK